MNNEINILITSSSRKVWLIEQFKETLKKLELKGSVIAGDIDPNSSSFLFADKKIILPRSTSNNFIHFLKKYCKSESIKLLIPTRDGELRLFAEHKKEFEEIGTTVMVSDEGTIDICNDKYKFFKYLSDNDIKTPVTYFPNHLQLHGLYYPFSFDKYCIIKPRYGSGTKNVYKVNMDYRFENELWFFMHYVKDAIVQKYIDGVEYTIDVFSDFDKNIISIIPRERREVINGESVIGETIDDDVIINEAKRLISVLGTIGHVNVQCIKNDDGVFFIDLNPRYGGGSWLSIIAGGISPIWLIKLVQGEQVMPLNSFSIVKMVSFTSHRLMDG